MGSDEDIAVAKIEDVPLSLGVWYHWKGSDFI